MKGPMRTRLLLLLLVLGWPPTVSAQSFWRVHLELSHPTTATLATIRTEVNAQLVGLAIRDRAFDWAASRTIDDGQPVLVLELRFQNQTDATTFRDYLASRIATWRGLGVTGRISRHLCRNTEAAPTDCKQSNYAEQTI